LIARYSAGKQCESQLRPSRTSLSVDAVDLIGRFGKPQVRRKGARIQYRGRFQRIRSGIAFDFDVNQQMRAHPAALVHLANPKRYATGALR